jgi:hypothetical protein
LLLFEVCQPAMGIRLLAILALFTGIHGALAHDTRPRVDARVHDGGVCWDPDVEFPVPCDDDDD